MGQNDINLLVQKLLASDWNKMNFELFQQLVIETGKQVKKVLDVANLVSNGKTEKEQHK